MVHRYPFGRLLAWILILHFAHIPLPCDEEEELTIGHQRIEEEELDIDIVLLGTDPDDCDGEPADDDPENFPTPFGYYFLIIKASPSDGSYRLLRLCSISIPRILSSGLALSVSRNCMPLSRPVCSFAVSYTMLTSQAWREFLSVYLI